MRNWKKILKKQLETGGDAGISRSGVDPGSIAFLLIQAVRKLGKPLVAAFPELKLADRAAAECEAVAALAGIPLRILPIPECGRGKLLFPGGEARRARALNAALTDAFDLYIGSVHALTAPAPKPAETRESTLILAPRLEIRPRRCSKNWSNSITTTNTRQPYRVSSPGAAASSDLFSPAHDFPCRVEFFGDEIDSLRSFAPETQRSTGPLDEYRVIGRAGITAGGAAEADFFDYLAGVDFSFLSVYPEAGRERLGKYSGAEAVGRLDEIDRLCAKREDSFAFYDSAEGAFHPGTPPSEIEPPRRHRRRTAEAYSRRKRAKAPAGWPATAGGPPAPGARNRL